LQSLEFVIVDKASLQEIGYCLKLHQEECTRKNQSFFSSQSLRELKTLPAAEGGVD
jgi:hypothetical protein